MGPLTALITFPLATVFGFVSSPSLLGGNAR
jgi:hypothetical protein